jgi:hypothetical protein
MSRAFVATVLTSLLTLAGLTLWSVNASAEYVVDGPFTYDNLSFYRVHGGEEQASAPLDVGTAVREGLVKFHSNATTRIDVTADNLSDRPVFVQLGTLLVGATQDQVVGTEYILPPRSTGTRIDIFCVEKGRWETRFGGDAASYSTTGAVLPPGMVQLEILASSIHSPAGMRLRQLGVWLSVDDLLHHLSKTTEATDTPIGRLLWPTSLPAGLNNPALQSAERGYFDALRPKAESEGDVTGVVLAINGKLWSADVYSSADLFHRMWPTLLQAGIAQATAGKGTAFKAPPEISQVKAFLSQGAAAPVIDQDVFEFRGVEKRDDNSVAYYESRSAGNWLHREYLAKDNVAAPAMTLQYTALNMLQTRTINERRKLAGADALGDWEFQIQLLSNIATDTENQILRSANIETESSARSRALLEPVLDQTSAILNPPVIRDAPGPVATTADEGAGVFKWLMAPLLLLALYAAAALYSMIRHSSRHAPQALRKEAPAAAVAACVASQPADEERAEQDLAAIFAHDSSRALAEWDDLDPLWIRDDVWSAAPPIPGRAGSRSPSGCVVRIESAPSPALFICVAQNDENRSVVPAGLEQQNELMEAA